MPGTPFVPTSAPSDADVYWDEAAGVISTTKILRVATSGGAPALIVDDSSIGGFITFKENGTQRGGVGVRGAVSGNTAHNDVMFWAETGLAIKFGVNGSATPVMAVNSSGQLTFGSAEDTNLYRSAAAVLATDSSIITTGTTTFVVAGNGTASEVKIGPAGPGSLPGIVWGSAEDTNLYRSAANTLKTDDAFYVAGVVTTDTDVNVGGSVTANRTGQYIQMGYLQAGGLTGARPGIEFRSGGPVNIHATADTSFGITLNSESTQRFVFTTTGLKFNNADMAQTTVGAAGGASALPATPTKYIKVIDSAGTTLVIPAYAAA
jgi:hypothetical protein